MNSELIFLLVFTSLNNSLWWIVWGWIVLGLIAFDERVHANYWVNIVAESIYLYRLLTLYPGSSPPSPGLAPWAILIWSSSALARYSIVTPNLPEATYMEKKTPNVYGTMIMLKYKRLNQIICGILKTNKTLIWLTQYLLDQFKSLKNVLKLLNLVFLNTFWEKKKQNNA